MDNAFAILGLPSTLILAPPDVEEAWRVRARSAHPDAGQGDSSRSDEHGSAELNRARDILLNPALRLEHWLILNNQKNLSTASLEGSTLELFSVINEAIAKADEAIEKQKSATTALGKAIVAGDAVAAQLLVQEQLGTLQSRIAEAADRFGEIEAAAANGRFEPALVLLAQLRFLKKWESECQKRLLELIAL